MEGFNYTGMGNSTNKKDAQSNAARDFVNYLVRINEVKSEEVPAVGVSTRGPALETYVTRSCLVYIVPLDKLENFLLHAIWRHGVMIFQCFQYINMFVSEL